MPGEPRLIDVRVPDEPEGVVLVLHGGASRGEASLVSPTQPSVLRMVPVARRIARAGRRRLAVFRVLNSQRGWDAAHTPVQDAAWALETAAQRLGRSLPSCLVGHSLGGRAALLAAGRPTVRGVVALAPWVDPGDTPAGLTDQRILFLHGSADRVASPVRSRALADTLARRVPVAYVEVAGAGHAMVRRGRLIDGLAARFARLTLLDEVDGDVMRRVAAGEGQLRV